jgi:outer membrane protein, heavy metal efflux system
MSNASRTMPRLAACALCASLTACAAQRYDARPLDAAATARVLDARSLAAADLQQYIQSTYPGGQNLAWPPRRWNLDLLTLAAFHFNPDLAAARARLAAAEAGTATARQIPNPTVQLPLQYTLDPRDGGSSWTLGLAVDIPVETAGKRGYRVAQAAHGAAAARLRVADQAWRLRSQVRAQLLNVWLNGARIGLLGEQAELDRALAAMLDKRLQEGYASAIEVDRQTLAALQTNGELLAARREHGAARIRLAGLLGLKPDALDGVELDLAAFAQPAAPVATAGLRALALLNRADVLAALASYDASQAALQLEIARQYPDLHLGPGYTFDQGARKPGFDFAGIELPIFNRNEGPIAQARARREEAAANVLQAQGAAWSELDAALAADRLARDALREAEAQCQVQQGQLAAGLRAFDLGEEDRLALTLGRKTAVAARLALLDASAQVQRARGGIEDAIQRPLAASGAPANPMNGPR